jgi:hypothetical protein
MKLLLEDYIYIFIFLSFRFDNFLSLFLGALMWMQNIYFIFIFNFRVNCMFILGLSI